MPDTRKLVLLAAATAVVIAALCFVGNTPVAGLKLATIVTARFSGLIFTFALVARASQLASRRVTLMLAFVAAHGVHFATVVARAIVDRASDFHNSRTGTGCQRGLCGRADQWRGCRRNVRLSHGILATTRSLVCEFTG